MISKFLFYEEESESKEEKNSYIQLKIEIRDLIKDRFNHLLLSEILQDLQKDVSGNTQRRLYKMYKDLGLHLDAFKKLKSWRWEVVSQGIFELTQMQVAESYGFISQFINDKRGVVRKQAEIATVSLKHEGLSYFLDTTRCNISEWQQLKLMDVINNLEDFEPPRFKKWLTSTNKDVVLFSLRLIRHYNQNDTNASIIELIRHKNNQIKSEAIYCIKKFCVFEARETLKNMFWKSNTEVKIIILDAIASFEIEEDVAFLKHVEKKESNFTIKSKALSSINTIIPGYILPTKGLSKVEPTNSKMEVDSESVSEEPIDNTELPKEEELVLNEVDAEVNEKDEEIKTDTISLDSCIAEEEETPKIESVEENYIIEEILEEIEPEVKEETKVVTSPRENVFEKVYAERDTKDKELLLDIIDKNGDHREIPLLKEIAAKEKNMTIKERALEIIFAFSGKGPNSLKEVEKSSLEEDYQGKSIFEKLFYTSDSISKLMLLDEILEVGDHKEIPFLESLTSHSDRRICQKAKLVKQQLKAKLEELKPPEVEESIEIEENTGVEIDLGAKDLVAFYDENDSGFIEVKKKKKKIVASNESVYPLEDVQIEVAKPKIKLNFELEGEICKVSSSEDSEQVLFSLDKENTIKKFSNSLNSVFNYFYKQH
ncbi:MAG: hypothetical protein V3U92_20815 [Cellulophaga sp.]